jgi:hypothetical protein
VLSAVAAAVVLAAAPATHDRVFIYLGFHGPVYIYYFDTRSPSLASTLHVFHERRGLRDLLPNTLIEDLDYDTPYRPTQSRLLLRHGNTRLYAIPMTTGGLCFYDETGTGYCTIRLLHGAAYPFVDPRTGRVFGLLSDNVVRVDVHFANGTRRATIGRNSFITAGTHAKWLVATERNGNRHVYTFQPCWVVDSNEVLPIERPLDPLPDYCG